MTTMRRIIPAKTKVYADFSRAELHIIGPVSGDQNFLDAIHDTDFHRRTISRARKIPMADVQPQEREVSKRVIYSLFYSAFTPEVAASYAARDLGLPFDEMMDMVIKILEDYPDLVEWCSEEILSWYDNEGWITYLCNARKMVAPQMHTPRDLNKLRGSEPARVAINQIAQNSIGLLLKMVFAAMRRHPMVNECEELWQAFDAIGFVAPTANLDYITNQLSSLMTTVLVVENERTGKTCTTIVRADISVSTQGYKQAQKIPAEYLPSITLDGVQPLAAQFTDWCRQNNKTAHYQNLSQYGTPASFCYWKRPANANPFRAAATPLEANPLNPFQNPLAVLEDTAFLD